MPLRGLTSGRGLDPTAAPVHVSLMLLARPSPVVPVMLACLPCLRCASLSFWLECMTQPTSAIRSFLLLYLLLLYYACASFSCHRYVCCFPLIMSARLSSVAVSLLAYLPCFTCFTCAPVVSVRVLAAWQPSAIMFFLGRGD